MADVTVERIDTLKTGDLHDLCDAADDAVKAGGGFGWVAPPAREIMERYWKGVLVVPERILFVGRLDGVIAGSAQLVKPARNNEAQAHAATLTTSFVAPWARGHGLARRLTVAVEEEARASGFRVLNLDVRETQTAAIALYEDLGFKRWGTHPFYALVDGKRLAGHFYVKDLTPDTLHDTP
ncbi:GNAT family N-acetyltransferase [Azospirillum brasilense]|uniref:GNAT family N-acetyltransferase n=2 Tax=Azospirillum TaxID=191 RepID=A0A4D8QZR8_AZOBR|nr:GNAT family N-acetyltransferase [Azospirillum brasilense]QCO15141.1 GNAT family N-acetyltransferase [Azospirillum brasilense]